jgi:hypothetical protein
MYMHRKPDFAATGSWEDILTELSALIQTRFQNRYAR